MNTIDWLIADYLEPDPTDPAPTSYRLRGSHIPVLMIAARIHTYDGNTTDLAADLAMEFGIYHRAIDAVIAFSMRHREAFAWRITTAECRMGGTRPPLPPWWLDVAQMIGMAVVLVTMLLFFCVG